MTLVELRQAAMATRWLPVALVGIIGYPWLAGWLIQRFELRPVAAVACLFAVAGLAAAWSRLRARPEALIAIGAQIGALALFALAAALDDRGPLLLIPVLIQLVLCLLFRATLREPPSMVERMARLMQPLAPEWVGPYCRKVTLMWCGFFLANAVVILWLTALGQLELWVRYTGGVLYLIAAGLQVGEFFVRKWWFRYYRGGVLDRFIRPIFPPENTERGRRSMEHIRQMRSWLESQQRIAES